MIKVAIYARTSTPDQQSIPMQIAALREYAERRQWSVVEEISEADSGSKTDRPGRKKIINLASKGKIEAVLVWKLNRWSRSTTDLLLTLNTLQAHGCAFVSLSENLDFTSPAGRLMAGILAVFAQFEREIIIENVNAGLEAYRKKGGRLGRPDRARAKTERVLQLRDAGKTADQIAKELDISRASVYRCLRRCDK